MGDDDEWLLIQLNTETNRFIEFVCKSPLLEWATFTKKLPESRLLEWSEQLNLSSKELDDYITRQQARDDRPLLAEGAY